MTGSQSLFKRLGRLGAVLNNANGYLGATAPAATPTWGSTIPIVAIGPAFDNIDAEFATTDQDIAQDLYPTRDSYRLAHSQLTSFLQSKAQTILLRMVNDDVTMKNPTSVSDAMTELIRQMTSSVDSVLKPTVTATVATVTATGDPVLIASVTGPSGVQRDYLFAEVLNVLCTSSSRGTSGYADTYTVQGNPLASGSLNWDYPAGSGAFTTLATVDANVLGPQLLTNGDFETFTVADTPDNWTVTVGTASTDMFAAGGGQAYFGGNALKFTGTGGAPLNELRQSVSLAPSTVYAVNCVLKKTTSLAAGVLALDLYDGSSVIADAASTNNSMSKTLSTLSTSYAAFNGFFRTPAVLPASTLFRVRLSTALTSGESMYLDRLAMVPATELYKGGPFAAMFAGKTRSALNDKYTVTTANNGFTNPGVVGWQKLFEQFFGMKSLGLQLPSAGSPTIAATLIN